MAEVNEAHAHYSHVTNQREHAFKKLRKLSSGVCLLLRASGSDELTMNDAWSINRRIWGRGKTKSAALKEQPSGEVKPKTSFVYGRDYATIANQLARLIETVQSLPKYSPTEKAFSVEGLQEKLAELQHMNDVVTQAEIRLSNARKTRNEVYYLAEDSILAIAIAAKNYIRGVFGYRSPQHLEVQRIRITKPRA